MQNVLQFMFILTPSRRVTTILDIILFLCFFVWTYHQSILIRPTNLKIELLSFYVCSKKIDLAARHYILLEEGAVNKKVPFCMRLVGLDGDDRTKQQQVRRRIEKILSEGKETSVTADFPILSANIPNTAETVISPLSLPSNSSITLSKSASTKKAFNLTSSQVQKQQKHELNVKKNNKVLIRRRLPFITRKLWRKMACRQKKLWPI